jgi:hypothetical protein
VRFGIRLLASLFPQQDLLPHGVRVACWWRGVGARLPQLRSRHWDAGVGMGEKPGEMVEALVLSWTCVSHAAAVLGAWALG